MNAPVLVVIVESLAAAVGQVAAAAFVQADGTKLKSNACVSNSQARDQTNLTAVVIARTLSLFSPYSFSMGNREDHSSRCSAERAPTLGPGPSDLLRDLISINEPEYIYLAHRSDCGANMGV